jgi:hypothetical protein
MDVPTEEAVAIRRDDVRSQRIVPKSQLIVPAQVRTVTAARRCVHVASSRVSP